MEFDIGRGQLYTSCLDKIGFISGSFRLEDTNKDLDMSVLERGVT